jgi:hypothetical protein
MDSISNGHRCMTQAEYARYSGLDPSYVSRLVKMGIIPLNSDARIDPDEADAARRMKLRLRMPNVSKPQRQAKKAVIDQAVARLLLALNATVSEDQSFEVRIRLDYVGQGQGRFDLQAGPVDQAES